MAKKWMVRDIGAIVDNTSMVSIFVSSEYVTYEGSGLPSAKVGIAVIKTAQSSRLGAMTPETYVSVCSISMVVWVQAGSRLKAPVQSEAVENTKIPRSWWLIVSERFGKQTPR